VESAWRCVAGCHEVAGFCARFAAGACPMMCPLRTP
jgi:hypothetical protein